jgi:hypothetical protein
MALGDINGKARYGKERDYEQIASHLVWLEMVEDAVTGVI